MLLEEGITPAGPDMIAGIDAQPRDVLLEVAKFNARIAKNVQSLQVGVIPFCDVARACDFECCD